MSEQQNEIEYIEPTQEHVRQMVEVRDIEEQAWVVRKLITILDDQYEFHFVCEDGKLRHLTRSWKYARIPRPKPQPIQEQPTKPIDWTKPVRTKRTKKPVRIACTDGPGDYPVVGFISGDIDPYTWTLDGQNVIDEADDMYDLENAPSRIQLDLWVNVYPNGNFYTYRTREHADAYVNGRFVCVKITIDCEEGEGL